MMCKEKKNISPQAKSNTQVLHFLPWQHGGENSGSEGDRGG